MAEGIMKRNGTAVALACGMLLAAAGVARAERFEGVKYVGGVKGLGSRTGTLVIEDGRLRFEDKKGREVFSRGLESARAWVGTEKRTHFGKFLRNVALLPVTIPVAANYGGDPWVGGSRKFSPIVMVKTGPDAVPLRLRMPFARMQEVVDAVGREAAHGTPAKE
jgi:hypothetical protein